MSEEDSDDDDNDIPYNPKNLPLGWDGKVSCSAVPELSVSELIIHIEKIQRSPICIVMNEFELCPPGWGGRRRGGGGGGG